MQAIAASAMPSDEVIDVAPAHITTMWSDESYSQMWCMQKMRGDVSC